MGFALLSPPYACYNFVRIHKTLRVTPAMAAGVTDKLWEIGDLVKVLEDFERSKNAFEPQARAD